MIIDISGKLEAHLCGHKRMGDAVIIEIVVQVWQVQSDIFTDDIYGGAAGDGRIDIHHTGIETVAGIGCHPVAGMQFVMPLIPMAESDEVGMQQLTALRHAGRS